MQINSYLFIMLGLIFPTMMVPAEVKEKVAASEEANKRSPDQLLLDAAYAGSTYWIEKALERGANINAKDRFGTSALLHAIKNGHYEALALLLYEGADVNMVDALGFTPLIFAVYVNDAKAAKILLDHEADVSFKDNKGYTALDYAMNPPRASKNKKLISLLWRWMPSPRKVH